MPVDHSHAIESQGQRYRGPEGSLHLVRVMRDGPLAALSLCQAAVCVHSADSRTVGKRLAQAHSSDGFAYPITTELLSLPLAMAEVQVEV